MATCLQNYLVCIEMLGFSIAHHFTFTYSEYQRIKCQMQGIDNTVIGTEPLLLAEECDVPPCNIPLARQLSSPMSFSEAFWSSSVPRELLSDLKRYSVRGADSIIEERTTMTTRRF